MAATGYMIRGGVAGRERLRVLARVMWPGTRDHLARLGIEPGMRCLDVGCGGGDVTLELARLAGPSGAVVGVDLDEVKLDIARDEAEAGGYTNVEYRAGAVEELAQDGSFDVVYARFLLTHLPDPRRALARMAGAARPGAVVAIEDIDWIGGFCHPANEAWDAFWQLYPALAQVRAGDARLGSRLPALLSEAGLVDVDVTITQPAGRDTDVKLLAALTLENIADGIVEAGLRTADEVAALVDELYALTADPQAMVCVPRIVHTRARVPA